MGYTPSGTYATLQKPSTLPAATAAGLLYPFDSSKSAYNVTPASLSRARAAAARALSGLGRLDIAVVGTSLSGGYGISGTRVGKSWPEQFRALMVAKSYPDGGSGFIAAQSNLSAPTTDPRVTITAGWTAYAAANNTLMQGTTVGNLITFADPKASTAFDIWYVDYGTFNLTYTVDGGAGVNTALTNTGTLKKISVTGLTSAAHTITITGSAGMSVGTPLYIMGVTFKNTTGICIHNIGVGGLSINGETWGTRPYAPITLAASLAPQLTFVEVGTNDGSPLAASWTTNVQSFITSQVALGSDVVLIGEPPTSTGTRPIPAVLAADYALADTNNLAVVDLSDRLVSYAQATTLALVYNGDALGVHYNEGGYAAFARTIDAALAL